MTMDFALPLKDIRDLSSYDVEKLRSLLPANLVQADTHNNTEAAQHLEVILQAIQYIRDLQNKVTGSSHHQRF